MDKKNFSNRTSSVSFELHFSRKPNSERLLATDNLKYKLLLDEQKLERDLLTAADRRETCESRPRIKVVRKGCQSRDVLPKFKQEITQIANRPYYRSLEQLTKSANEWTVWNNKLTHEEGCRALRTLTERKQFLAAFLRNSLTTGTLSFRQDTVDSPTCNTKCKLESVLLSNPKSLKKFRKVANHKLRNNYLNVICMRLSKSFLQRILKIRRKY